MNSRLALTLLIAVAGTAACDAAITDIGQADSELLAQVARVSSGSVTPGERVLVEMLQRAATDEEAPIVLPQLDSLFTLALRDDAPDPDRLASRHRTLVRDAWRAIDAGDPTAGERWLNEARSVQSELVASRFGTAGALGYIALVGRSLDRSEALEGPRSARHIRHMLDTARDLYAESRDAVRQGRLALAFDLASHAAGLANTIGASVRD